MKPCSCYYDIHSVRFLKCKLQDQASRLGNIGELAFKSVSLPTPRANSKIDIFNIIRPNWPLRSKFICEIRLF